MAREHALPPAGDKLLFTPGPLTTSLTVRQALLRDYGSRDAAFIALVRRIRAELLAVGGVSQADGYEAIPLQGSGTYGLEAVVSSVIPAEGKLLLVINGAYGRRLAEIAAIHGIAHTRLSLPEHEPVDAAVVAEALAVDPAITHVSLVHCETTTGLLNPLEALGRVVRAAGKVFIVDAMSSFGGVPLNVAAAEADFLISSANKCIEGVPGFCFVIARRAALEASEGAARTLSLDLLAQWRGLEATGQFRFTPPTHALVAFAQALEELAEEGGVAARAARYAANQQIVWAGMQALGFEPYLDQGQPSAIITSFRYPDDAAFDFDRFYDALSARGFLIYPGKVSDAACFRIGHIGRLGAREMRNLLAAVRDVLAELGIHNAAAAAR